MIGARLGFNLSADFLKNLGFEAAKVKAACLYQEADFPLICMRLVSHIQQVHPFQQVA
jgi:fido (protein-threonine AMPylation protein)